MKYSVRYSERAVKELTKLDRPIALMIYAWVTKNLEGTSYPRQHGKALTGKYSGYWRYRVGSYRLIAEIVENEVRIDIIKVGHRSKIYG